MLRNLTGILALAALLSTAACSNVTGPAADVDSHRGGTIRGGDRTPSQFDDADQITPDPGQGGGAGDAHRVLVNRRGLRRTPVEITPGEGEGGGGGDNGDAFMRFPRGVIRRGQQVAP